MDIKLLNFLNSKKIYSNKSSDVPDVYTHTSQMTPNTGKYCMDYSNMEEFWKLYCDNVWENGDDFKSGLSEKPNEYMPILADIDLAFGVEENKIYDSHIYTEQQLILTVKIYFDVIKYCIKNYDPEDLVCFVLEKKKPYVSGVRVKNGFHLHFPRIFMSHHEQDIQVIPRIIRQMEERNVFQDIGIKHSGQVIDKSCTKKHWLLYGSRKDINLEAYKLTRVLDDKANPIPLEEVLNTFNLYNYDEEIINYTDPKHLGGFERDDISYLEYYLPRILSVHPHKRTIYKCNSSLEIILKDTFKKAKEFKGTFENMSMTQIIDSVRQLMAMINPIRADMHESWIEIGWIVYNITQGCREGMDMWIEFSKKTKCDNFNESECIWQWNKMELRGYTIGSLRYYASIDSPSQYKLLIEEESAKRVEESLSGGHYDLAKQLHDILANKYVCASIDKHLWYEFKNHRWIRVDKGISLRARINSDLYPKYAQKAPTKNEVLLKNNKSEDDDKRSKKLHDISGKLKTASFKDAIMKECQEIFYNGDFYDLLDNNKYLLGFNNGILDLKKCEFRSGLPEDYVTMTTGYDYKEYCDEDSEIQEIELILTKFFPDPTLRKYYMEYCARLLKGGNDAKTFMCMTGDGDNGKSMAIELIEGALGCYMIKLPTALLIGKRTQSSAACPELARSNSVRFAVLQEPDGTDTVNAGILKELSGNDSIYVRGLFQAGKEIKPMFKLGFICNKLPRLNADDQATWNRVRVLTFESRFPKNNSEVPSSWDDQMKKKVFYRDSKLSERFEHLKAAFMWMMFRTYKECMKTGWMDDPKRVMEATAKYRQNNDIMLQFINECIKCDPRPSSNINLNDLFNSFKSWFSMTFNGVKMPSKNDIKEDLLKRWGLMTFNKWIGYRLKTAEDDIDEGRTRKLAEDDFTDHEYTDGDFD